MSPEKFVAPPPASRHLNPFERMLLQLRDDKDKKYPNQWCFPGGGKDAVDETYIDTLLRETKEEFNVDLKIENCEDYFFVF